MKTEVISYTKNIDKKHSLYPAEDALKVSEKYPIFAVADGVFLKERNKDGSYPISSGAKQVADAFCRKSVEWVERNYQNFTIAILKNTFEHANKAIKEINDKTGRTKETINFWDFDFFSTTAALAIIKKNQLFYGRIHDCWITVIDETGKIKLSLIEPWDWECGKRALARRPKEFQSLSEQEQETHSHKYERNAIIEEGILAGYAVLTGEEEALRYLETGSITLEKGDVVLIYTDGFEHYDKLKEFIDIFVSWEKNGKEKTELALKQFSQKKAQEDKNKFGHERTLVAVRCY